MNEATGQVKKLGDIVRNPVFAQTLRTIAREGVGAFYNGTLGDKMVQDIRRKGGIITKDDLMQYRYLKKKKSIQCERLKKQTKTFK